MGLSNTEKVKLDCMQEVLDLTQFVHKTIDIKMPSLKIFDTNRLFKDEKRILPGFSKLGVVTRGSSYSGEYGLISEGICENLSGLEAARTRPIEGR